MGVLYDNAVNGAKYIIDRIEEESIKYEKPVCAIVLGSALGVLAEHMTDCVVIPYCDIPFFVESTVPGHAGTLIYGKLNKIPLLVMNGRFHIYEGNSPQTVVNPIRTFRLMGIENVILTNAAGGINEKYKVGQFMIIEDHLSFFLDSPLTGLNEDEFGLRFPSMDNAYNRTLIQIAEKCAAIENIDIQKGIYAYMKGPTFETPAEIRALKMLGADAVGMSTVPETIAAVHCGMNVLGLSCISNMAAGISDVPISHDEVNKAQPIIAKDFVKLIKSITANIM